LCGEKRSDERQFYFRRIIDGKRYIRRLQARTLSEAQTEYAEWLHSIGVKESRQTVIVTLAQVADAYLDKLKAEKRRYYAHARLYLRRLIDFCGDGLCNEITPDILRRFQTFLRQSGAAPANCDRHLEMGCAAWNYSLKGRLPNPFEAVNRYRPDNTLVRELTLKEEADILLAAKGLTGGSPPRFYEMLAVAIYTGMRAANVFRLRADEVDFIAGVINVRQKGNRSHQAYMNSVVRKALHDIEPNEDGWYFPNPRTGRPYLQVRKSFAIVKALARIKRPFRFHDLRHHFAKRVAEVTHGNVLLIKGALGHRDIKTSMKYVPPFQREIRAALEQMIDTSREQESPKQSPIKTNRTATG